MDEIREKGRARGKEALKEVGKIQEEVHENLEQYSDLEPRRPLTLEEVQEGRMVYHFFFGLRCRGDRRA